MTSKVDPVPLEVVVRTGELDRRPSRAPRHAVQGQALQSLAQALAEDPRGFAQHLAATVLQTLQAGSAGISLRVQDAGGTRFHWSALVGAWQAHAGTDMPGQCSLCADAMEIGGPVLFEHPERRYGDLSAFTPAMAEGLLVPLVVDGVATGALCAIAHDDRRRFDAEDLRLLQALGQFAACAWRVVAALTARDLQIAAQQQAHEALLQADRRKDEFLATLAHELRHPLAPMRTALGLMQRTDSNLLRDARETMERQLGHLERLVDDLLDIARIRSGKMDLRLERVDLSSIVRQVEETARPALDAAGHEFIVALPAQRVVLNADRVRLTQALGNMLDNACKYSEPRGRIELRAWCDEHGVVVSLKDRGIGIARDMLARIFDLFTQAQPSTERAYGGLGVGLALAQRLIQMHNGTISAFSEGRGRGSEFIVRLPILAVEEGPVAPPRAALPPPAGPVSHSRRVLVVDDNVDAAASLAALLELDEHVTQVAHTGPEAVDVAATFAPDVVLLDLDLPQMNGYEVARRIRTSQGGSDVLLVAVTGWSRKEDRDKTRAAGFDAHLIKPTDLGALTRLLGASVPRPPS